MAIVGVDTKCYILALFIRSDGERFLLGSGHYEFNSDQMQFEANTMANDVVEVQGNDGYLLAGQVRRPGTQSFDGYVGDGTTSKTDVETYRRAFFEFFRKNYSYKVIYVFPDGSAIQRKRGFLVDAPTVKELYQQYPAYHVALNFEDINYYYYNEDADGQEIYGKSATIGLAVSATGGLIWDALGAVSIGYTWASPVEVSGSEITINNQLSVPAPIENQKLYGDTFQQTYSGKNLMPLAVSDNTTSRTNAFRISLPAGTYTISFDLSEIELGTNESFTIQMTIAGAKSGGGNYDAIISGTISSTTATYKSFTFTTTADSDINTNSNIRIAQTYWDNGARAKLSNIQIEAGSTPTSYEPYVGGTASPNPDYPQDIQTVTGEQTVTINGEQVYTIDLGVIELCKIGDYQDYIYKSGDDWYIHKETTKETFNGTENWNYGPISTFYRGSHTYSGWMSSQQNFYNSHFVAGNTGNTPNVCAIGSTQVFMSMDASLGVTTKAEWLAWLSNNNVTMYAILATPTDTIITDSTLIGQLEALGAMKIFVGTNTITTSATGTNLPAILDFEYYTDVDTEGAGYEWEPGEAGGDKNIMVDSIDNVYPLLTITGPAVNPTITNITTGAIFAYSGTVTASQALKVDMMAKTATLNGVSVLGNVTQDWLYFKPGNNRVEYTTDNTDSPDALIEWQEIVG